MVEGPIQPTSTEPPETLRDTFFGDTTPPILNESNESGKVNYNDLLNTYRQSQLKEIGEDMRGSFFGALRYKFASITSTEQGKPFFGGTKENKKDIAKALTFKTAGMFAFVAGTKFLLHMNPISRPLTTAAASAIGANSGWGRKALGKFSGAKIADESLLHLHRLNEAEKLPVHQRLTKQEELSTEHRSGVRNKKRSVFFASNEQWDTRTEGLLDLAAQGHRMMQALIIERMCAPIAGKMIKMPDGTYKEKTVLIYQFYLDQEKKLLQIAREKGGIDLERKIFSRLTLGKRDSKFTPTKDLEADKKNLSEIAIKDARSLYYKVALGQAAIDGASSLVLYFSFSRVSSLFHLINDRTIHSPEEMSNMTMKEVMDGLNDKSSIERVQYVYNNHTLPHVSAVNNLSDIVKNPSLIPGKGEIHRKIIASFVRLQNHPALQAINSSITEHPPSRVFGINELKNDNQINADELLRIKQNIDNLVSTYNTNPSTIYARRINAFSNSLLNQISGRPIVDPKVHTTMINTFWNNPFPLNLDATAANPNNVSGLTSSPDKMKLVKGLIRKGYSNMVFSPTGRQFLKASVANYLSSDTDKKRLFDLINFINQHPNISSLEELKAVDSTKFHNLIEILGRFNNKAITLSYSTELSNNLPSLLPSGTRITTRYYNLPRQDGEGISYIINNLNNSNTKIAPTISWDNNEGLKYIQGIFNYYGGEKSNTLFENPTAVKEGFDQMQQWNIASISDFANLAQQDPAKYGTAYSNFYNGLSLINKGTSITIPVIQISPVETARSISYNIATTKEIFNLSIQPNEGISQSLDRMGINFWSPKSWKIIKAIYAQKSQNPTFKNTADMLRFMNIYGNKINSLNDLLPVGSEKFNLAMKALGNIDTGNIDVELVETTRKIANAANSGTIVESVGTSQPHSIVPPISRVDGGALHQTVTHPIKPKPHTAISHTSAVRKTATAAKVPGFTRATSSQLTTGYIVLGNSNNPNLDTSTVAGNILQQQKGGFMGQEVIIPQVGSQTEFQTLQSTASIPEMLNGINVSNPDTITTLKNNGLLIPKDKLTFEAPIRFLAQNTIPAFDSPNAYQANIFGYLGSPSTGHITDVLFNHSGNAMKDFDEITQMAIQKGITTAMNPDKTAVLNWANSIQGPYWWHADQIRNLLKLRLPLHIYILSQQKGQLYALRYLMTHHDQFISSFKPSVQDIFRDTGIQQYLNSNSPSLIYYGCDGSIIDPIQKDDVLAGNLTGVLKVTNKRDFLQYLTQSY